MVRRRVRACTASRSGSTGGLWSALGRPPPWHSAAKTLGAAAWTPSASCARSTRLEHCAVADSFGDLELDRLRLRAPDRGPAGSTAVPWTTRPRRLPGRLVGGRHPQTASRSGRVAHDYVGVLPPAVLDHPRFHDPGVPPDGVLVGGAVTHDGDGVGGALQRAGAPAPWPVSAERAGTRWPALHPGRSFTDFAEGVELDAMLAAGFTRARPAAGLDPLSRSARRHRSVIARGPALPARLPWRHELRRGEDRRGVARAALAGGVRRPAPGRHRAAVRRRVHRHRDQGRLPLQGVPARAVRVRHQVPLRLRLAELLPAGHRHRGVHRGRHPRDEAGRGALRELRLPPGPRLPRRLRHAHRRPLLHQLDRDHPRARRPARRAGPADPVETALRAVDVPPGPSTVAPGSTTLSEC